MRDEISLPLINALSEKAKVMLLANCVVELGLFNGAVGVVVDIICSDAEGPRNHHNKPACVVVDFPPQQGSRGRSVEQRSSHLGSRSSLHTEV